MRVPPSRASSPTCSRNRTRRPPAGADEIQPSRRHPMKLPLLALSLAALLQAAPAAAQDVVRIRLAHSLSTTEPAHLAAEYFAKNVAQRTNNKVQVQVFPSEQLGSGKEVNEMIRQGANVMNITDPGYLSDFVPDIGVLNGPYLVKTPADYEAILKTDWFKGIDKKLEAAGFKLI